MKIMVIKYDGETSIHDCDYFELRKNRVDANLLIVKDDKKEVLDNVAVVKSVKAESNDKMTVDEVIDLLNKLYLKANFTDEYGDMEDTEPYEEAIKMVTEALEQKPCEDAISRQAVLNLPRKALKNYFGDVVAEVIYVRDIMELPPVTPQPKIGEWINDSCSECGKGIEDLISSPEWYRNERPNFCPFCGIPIRK